MINQRTALLFAKDAYSFLIRYGRNDMKYMHGECFTHVDFKNKCVDVGISTSIGLIFWSFPIRKSWI